MCEKNGEISGLRVHPVFELQSSFQHGKFKFRRITYEADFEYYEKRKHVVEDVKGFSTAVFKLKHKLFVYKYPNIDFRIVKA